MKTVILAGRMGTRLAEETDNRPKPMVEIGFPGRPCDQQISCSRLAFGVGFYIEF